MFSLQKQSKTAVSVSSFSKKALKFVKEGLLCKYQKVDRVLWFDLAAVQHGLSERGHHVLHQVVPQRKRASFQQLVLLSLQL